MEYDRSAFKKGDLVYGEAHPGKMFDKRDMIVKGMHMILDCPVTSDLAPAAPRYGQLPSLDPIRERLNALEKKIEAAAALVRKARASS